MSVFLSTTADEVLLKDIKFNKNIYTKLSHMPSVGVCWHSSLASEGTLPKRIFKNTLCNKQIFECQVMNTLWFASVQLDDEFFTAQLSGEINYLPLQNYLFLTNQKHINNLVFDNTQFYLKCISLIK